VSDDVAIHPDVVSEARLMLAEADRQGLPLRVLGGMAVRLRAADGLPEGLEREIRDIDLATLRGQGRRVADFLERRGYAPNRTFNAMHGARRLLFYDEQHRRQVDVFVDSFEMCHVLPLSERLLLEPETVPLAELLLTKLQIVQLNPKDRSDVYALLLSAEVGDDDGDHINARRIAALCARDWGLYRTLQLNLERLATGLSEVELTPAQRQLVAARLQAIEAAMAAAPKTARWRMRARVGDRVRWYEEPDEVDRGGY
jgi:hypothetical protein